MVEVVEVVEAGLDDRGGLQEVLDGAYLAVSSAGADPSFPDGAVGGATARRWVRRFCRVRAGLLVGSAVLRDLQGGRQGLELWWRQG